MSLNSMAARMQYRGGDRLGRLNKQKLNSLKIALENDYQSRVIDLLDGRTCRCLMNHSDIKSDYDKKVISVPFDSLLEPGDVYQCIDDNTYWMIYLPYITETAYLRSQVVRCRYTLEVNEKLYHLYFQGPTETDLRWYIKNSINTNELNLSGTIYIKNDENTKSFFKRFTHIKLDGHVWEVQVTDSITVPGVLELEVQEYYDNTPAELPEIKKECCQSQIIGKQLVKQDSLHGYEIEDKFFKLHNDYVWSVLNNPRVSIKEVYEDGRLCKVKIEQGAIGSFTLKYGNDTGGLALNVDIDISDATIHGPQSVHPYDECNYYIDKNKRKGAFNLETSLAKIIHQDGHSCKIEILTGKKGKFTLYFNSIEDNYELPIEIKSF